MRLDVLVAVFALFGYALGRREVSGTQDSVSCSRHVERSDGTILDIKKSVRLGAELLLGTWSKDQKSCLSSCCDRSDCDMALYKTDGVSMKGNNCYLVHCGSRENCHMVPLESFNTFYLTAKSDSQSGDPSHTLDTLTEHNGPKVHGKGDARTTNSPTHLSTPSAVPHTDDAVKPKVSTLPARTEVGVAATTSVIPDKSDHKYPTNSSNEHDSTKSVDFVKSTDSSKAANEQNARDKDALDSAVKNKACGAYGCDGSGIVAVVVVAAICVAIIIVVGAILLKKVVDERRRKKFRNVDYLINGMYT